MICHTIFRIQVVLLLWLCSGVLKAQTYKEADLLSSLENEYPGYKITLDPVMIGKTKVYQVNYTPKDGYYPKQLSLVMASTTLGYTYSTNNHQGSFDRTGNFKGKIYKVHPTKSSHLVATADTTWYGLNAFVTYRVYELKDGFVNDWKWELYTLFNVDCLGKNFESTVDFEEKDSKNHVITVSFSLDRCSENPTVYTWQYNWNSKKGDITVLKEEGVKEVSQYINSFSYPSGTWQVKKYKINGKEQRISDDLVKFDGAQAYVYRIKNIFDKEETKLFTLDTTDIQCEVTILNGNKFKGHFSQYENGLYIEGYDNQGAVHALEFENIFDGATFQTIKNNVDNGYQPSKQVLQNELRMLRKDVIELYFTRGFLSNQSSWNVLVQGTVETIDLIEYFIFTGELELLQMISADVDWAKYNTPRPRRLAKFSGNEKMMSFYDLKMEKVAQAEEEAYKKEQERARLALEEEITETVLRASRFDDEGAKVDIDVTNVYNSELLQIHNISVFYEDGAAPTKQFFDVHHQEMGMWRSNTPSYNVYDGSMQNGNVEQVFEIGEKTFLYVEDISSFRTYVEEYHTIKQFDFTDYSISPTNLEWRADYDIGGCDYTTTKFDFSFDNLANKEFSLEETTTVVQDCEAQTPVKKKSSFRWSSRQNKFLETLK